MKLQRHTACTVMAALALTGGAVLTYPVEPAGDHAKAIAYVHRQPGKGACSLRILQPVAKTTTITVTGLWLYDPQTRAWATKPFPKAPIVITPIQGRQADRPLISLPGDVGLYWIRWKEDDTEQACFAFSGPTLCNDIDIGPEVVGDTVATCIPYADHAMAAYVPDPRIYCR